MKLDHAGGIFRLLGNFLPAERAQIMREHGFDWSLPSHCLYTREPFAAVAFWEHATLAARAALDPLHREIEASWALEPAISTWPDHLCPPGETPYPLQLADLEYALRRKNCLVADEPGVGKTPTAIMYCNMLRARRVLAIVPASIRLQWANRVRQWSTLPDVQISVVANSGRGVPPTDSPINWTILSYDCAWREGIYQALVANHYDVLILDEAHYLKSPTARRTRAILGAADRGTSIGECADHVLALSGTPIPNRPREAYTLSRALCHEAVDFMSAAAFGERFNPRTVIRRATRTVGVREDVGRYHELQARLRASFMVRHLKRDAMPQLRLPVYDLVYADETAPVRAALEAEKLLDIDPETFKSAGGVEFDGQVSTARKLMGLALAPQVVAYAKMLLESGTDKLVVFGWHIEVLDLLQKGLDRFGVVRVDGRSTERDKQRAVQAFQKDARVILGNVLSLGTGTDGLQTVCSHAIIAEPDWVHGNNVQCIDRLDRGGQARTVQADIFVARGSLAEHVFGTALRKGRIVHATLDQRGR